MLIINIHGPMAAGKSTLTARLREELGFSYVDRPFIKRGLKPAGRKEALKISKEATYFIIEKLIELNKDMIVQEVNPESLKNKVDLKGYKVVSFFIKCDVNTAVERDKTRFKTPRETMVRNIHEKYVGPVDYEIVIDTEKLSVDECVEKMLGEITKANRS